MKIPWRYFAVDKITVCSILFGVVAFCLSEFRVFDIPYVLLKFFLLATLPAIFLSLFLEIKFLPLKITVLICQIISYYIIGRIFSIMLSPEEKGNNTLLNKPPSKDNSKVKKQKKAVIISIATVTLIVFGVCCYILPLYMKYRMECPQKCVLKSPLENINAVFLRHGFMMASQIVFYIESDKILIKVGTVESDDALVFNEACWSKDGTLIASKSRVTGYNEVPKTDEPFIFTHAYDLKEKKSYSPAFDISDKTPEAWVKRAKIIEKLLLERGGEGNKVIKGDSEMAKVSWWQWRKYRDMEKK